MSGIPICWPQIGNVGYPKCDTERGPDFTLLEPNLFQYCCPPAPVEISDISGVNPRPLYRNNVAKPHGVHNYYNLMWDGRIRRGDPKLRQAKKEEEECAKIRDRLNRPRKTKSLADKLAEKKKISFKAPQKTEQKPKEVPNTSAKLSTTPKAAAINAYDREVVRHSMLAIASIGTKDPEKYLVDLSDEIDVLLDPCYKGQRLQTLRTFPIAPSRATNLIDAGTQVHPTEFFDFDGEAQPVIEKMVGAVVDRAQLEILEEEELKALLLQQQLQVERFQNIRDNIENWKEREKIREEELERLEKQQNEWERSQDETVMLYNVCAFSGSLTKDGISQCIDDLRNEGFLAAQPKILVEREFIPWLDVKVEKEIAMRIISDNLLNEVIMDVVNNREAQYAESIWREMIESEPYQKYGNSDRTAPPPTPGTSLNEGDSGEDDIGITDYLNTTDEE